MKKLHLILLIFVFTFCNVNAQNEYFVTAENGLLIRDKPSKKGKRIGKFDFASSIQILEKTDKTLTIKDNGKEIRGNWVKVEIPDYPFFISKAKEGYIFNGYLLPEKQFIKNIKEELKKYKQLSQYTLYEDTENPFSSSLINGDFFGDGIKDYAIKVKNLEGSVKIAIINYKKDGKQTKIKILGEKDDPFNIDNYAWAGLFKKVPKGEVLWSNYEEDWRDFEEVPENEKEVLTYDSFFIHADESCGGGFIFWKNGKFNWLQQE